MQLLGSRNVYLLGGYQTDFARNWAREGKHVSALMREALLGAMVDADIDAGDIQAVHVGNFASELFCHQGQLGAFAVEAVPELAGVATSRHEAACASGAIAVLAASAEIEAGRYDCVAVVGVEQMKTVKPTQGADYLGTAGWYEKEAKGVEFPFPSLFGRLADEYQRRYGLRDEHLAEISAINYANAKRNAKAQTRSWFMSREHALERDEHNPIVGARLKQSDCSQVTDGAACVLLASPAFAEHFAQRRGHRPEAYARITGWGHRTARVCFDDKLVDSKDHAYVLPHTRAAITDAFRRAGIGNVFELSAIETHDCFTSSEYMAIDHFGLTEPGQAWRAIEDGTIARGGALPINPSGGLIGVGHPVGATGVRQVLDAQRQVTGQAGDCQVDGARACAVLNLGGSATTSCVFVIGR